MKKYEPVYIQTVKNATLQCRAVSNIAENAATRWNKVFSILTVIILFFIIGSCAAPRPSIPPAPPDPDETLNIYIYRFVDEPDDIFLEIIPGDRFRLPLIRGYRVRVDHNKIEIRALTDREVVEPEGQILPSGHVAQLFNLGRLPPIEYEVLIHYDYQTDRYFLTVARDKISSRAFRDEFSKIIIP